MQPRLRLRQRGRMLDLELASGFRWFLGATGAVLVAGAALTTPADAPVLGVRNAAPLGIAAVMALGALYHERWRWDPAQRRVEHRFGVGPAACCRSWPLTRMRSLRLGGVLIALPSEPGRGRLPRRRMRFDLRRSAVHLSLLDDRGRLRRIDLVKGPDGHRLAAAAQAIAAACGLPLHDDIRRQDG